MRSVLYGFNFKKGLDKESKKEASKITGTPLQGGEYWGAAFYEGSIAHKELFKEGVLELYFDRVEIDAITLKVIK